MYKKQIKITVLALLIVFCVSITNNVSAKKKNYWTTKESYQIKYNGYIQFYANYKTPKNPGYGLLANRCVKRAYINYSRNGKSVIGGRKYTPAAPGRVNKKYSKSASCWDSVIPGAKHRTKFNYGWLYHIGPEK